MNFGFSEAQEMLRESARKFLEAGCAPSFVRKMMEHETGHSTEFWKTLADLGWLGLLIPQELGGMSGSFLDAAVILEEAGKVLMPGPFFSTVLLGAAVVGIGGSKEQKKEILPRVAEGSAVMALGFLEDSERYDAGGIELQARRKGKDFVLNGEKVFVYDAGVADWIVVAARTARNRKKPEEGVTLFLVESSAPGLKVVPLKTVDMTRRPANLELDRVTVPAKRAIGRIDGGWPILRRVLELATAGICIETVGLSQRALEMSVAYAKERTQFGKPVGSFQAVKHKCVDMMVAVENARSLSYHAAWAVDQRDTEASRAVAMAKAYCSDMGKNVTADAIQVHGGIGFTWEHDIHLYYRRALANEATFGTAPLHREAVAQGLSL
jgi:alkylation response protein AidB-like acyl-CoA dehydrogenase